MRVNGHDFTPDEVLVERGAREGWALAEDGSLTVAVTTELDDELRLEGRVLDLIHQLNTMRKEAGLALTDRIRVTLPERTPISSRTRTGSRKRCWPPRSVRTATPSRRSRRPDPRGWLRVEAARSRSRPRSSSSSLTASESLAQPAPRAPKPSPGATATRCSASKRSAVTPSGRRNQMKKVPCDCSSMPASAASARSRRRS